jgi:hypothetical protein
MRRLVFENQPKGDQPQSSNKLAILIISQRSTLQYRACTPHVGLEEDHEHQTFSGILGTGEITGTFDGKNLSATVRLIKRYSLWQYR